MPMTLVIRVMVVVGLGACLLGACSGPVSGKAGGGTGGRLGLSQGGGGGNSGGNQTGEPSGGGRAGDPAGSGGVASGGGFSSTGGRTSGDAHDAAAPSDAQPAAGGAGAGIGGGAGAVAGGASGGRGNTDAGAAPSSTGGVGGSDATARGTFELAWQDDFNAFDTTRWQLMTHTWDGNLAQFSTQNATFANGIASLALTREPSDTLKPFRGVEMRSRQTITYGKVETRARLAKGSGVVSALVLIYTPYPADDWNELDIEYLGAYAPRVQFNTMVYTGPPTTPPVQQSVTPTQFPQLVTLDFDLSADFHLYAVEWTPTDVRFTVDGVVEHTWSAEIARMKRPQNILLTIWASSAADWAGPVVASSAPTTAQYDWVRVYTWLPPRP